MSNELLHETEALVHTAVLGKQADNFVQSDVGQYMVDRINAELNEAIIELKRADAFDGKAVQAAQNKVWRAENMLEWVSQIIMDGLRATNVLESREDD